MRALLLTLALVGCEGLPAQRSAATSNPAYAVDLLFEHDGCSVYRFYDSGEHYYAVCAGEASTHTTREVGPPKARRKLHEDIPTVRHKYNCFEPGDGFCEKMQ